MSVVQDRTAVINFVHTLTDKYDIDPKNGGKHDLAREDPEIP